MLMRQILKKMFTADYERMIWFLAKMQTKKTGNVSGLLLYAKIED